MITNKDRILYLREKLRQIDKEIQDKQLQDQYIIMQREVIKGTRKFEPIDDANWEIMLPKERDIHLLDYYHSLRVEVLSLQKELERQEQKSREDKLRWLESKWMQRSLMITTIIEFTITVYELGHQMGLWYEHEDSDTDYHGW